MTCQTFAEFLLEYLDGTLSWQQRTAFVLHLAICPDCRRYLHSYEQTVRLARSLGEETPDLQTHDLPEDLVQAILASRNVSTPQIDKPHRDRGRYFGVLLF